MRRTAALLVAAVLVTGCGATRPAESHPGHGTATSPSARRWQPSPFVPHLARAVEEPWRLPTPTARQAVVAVGRSTCLVAGGMLADDSSAGAVQRIDLLSGRSTPAPRLAVPVHDAAAGTYAGEPAVFGGGNTSEQSLVQALRHGRWKRVGAFPTTRSDLSVAHVGSRVGSATVALGGYDGSGEPTAVYQQRGAAPMRPLGRLARGVRYAATAVVSGKVYVFGGEVDGTELGTVQRYDPRSGRTAVVARLPRPLGHAMAAGFGRRVLLMGGRTDPDTQTAAMWWFDPATGRFAPAGRLPRPLSDAGVAVTGRSAYLLGGEDPSVTDRVVRVAVR